ncbi:FAD/NAD(P)-binding protein [Amycolatopsis sp. NPDC051071]|uniref:FAD/NAD(P)-binding protein n=1 Tax=Amycolatopsis sp. NPDC051071 TaxID=3154637 RepID=UPI00342AB862
MSSFELAIIGGGPRALSILERLVEHRKRLPHHISLNVLVIDPGNLGEGSHPTDQPSHLLINTLASQVTMRPPLSSVGGDSTPSVLDWAAEQRYRRQLDGARAPDRYEGQPVTERSHLPRVLLGEYLAAFGREVVSALPLNIGVQHVRARALDVRFENDVYAIDLDNGQTVFARYSVLAMGHGQRTQTDEDRRLATFAQDNGSANPHLTYFASPYPIGKLDAIASHARVAVQGLGLTAHDVVSALTLGRGGRYRTEKGRLIYKASGREPRIWLCSRQALPFAARGVNQKGRAGRHICQFFTPQAVARLRARAMTLGDARIDFNTDLLPLTITEMAYAYRTAESNEHVDATRFTPTPEEIRLIRRILWPLEDEHFRSPVEFRRWLLAFMTNDLGEAYRGNRTSGVKAATDVLRDAREAFRAAVEYGGLTPASHRYFVEKFDPIVNRVSFGPPLRRNEEWLALFEAGLLDVAGGAASRIETPDHESNYRISLDFPDGPVSIAIDVVISARLDKYSPCTDSSSLSANLLRRGLVRPFMNGEYHPSGIDIDENLRVKKADGRVHPRLWAVGFVVEGPHFYTHALPRPGITSRQTVDAERIVLGVFDDITTVGSTRSTATPDIRSEAVR